MKALLILVLFSVACNPFRKDNREQEPVNVEALKPFMQQSEFYLFNESLVTDENGWIEDSCDSLFTTCLHVAAGGSSNVFLSTDDDGRMWRRTDRVCLENGRWNENNREAIEAGELRKRQPASKSSMSRDPFIPCALVWWQTKDLPAVEKALEYPKNNSNNIGESDGSIEGNSRIKLSPTLKATLCEMRERLGGKNDKVCRAVPQVWGPATGSDAHLNVLHMLLRGKMFGAINDYTMGFLNKYIDDSPENGLFQAVKAKFTDGDCRTALATLKPKWFPPDKFPTSSDRCTANLWQHTMRPGNVEPCPEEKKKHPAVDFRLVVRICGGRI